MIDLSNCRNSDDEISRLNPHTQFHCLYFWNLFFSSYVFFYNLSIFFFFCVNWFLHLYLNRRFINQLLFFIILEFFPRIGLVILLSYALHLSYPLYYYLWKSIVSIVSDNSFIYNKNNLILWILYNNLFFKLKK